MNSDATAHGSNAHAANTAQSSQVAPPGSRLRVAVAAPLKPEHAALIVEREPRIDLAYEPDLLPPMRFAADFSGDPAFRRTPEQQRRYEQLLDGADALYGIPDVDPAALRRAVEANPSLRWVHTMAAGGGGQVQAAGLSEADLQRVTFTTSAGVHGVPLAEFAVFGVLAGAKNLPRLQRQQREKDWSDRWIMGQLAAQTALLYGLGGIGREVARVLSALGVSVVGVSRRTEQQIPGVARIVTPDEAIAVAGSVQAVVSALPGTGPTEKMLGRALFDAVASGTTFVNVGRGTVVDEAALLDALDDGRIGFAALDVFTVEPLSRDSPFWSHPSVLVSPHTAALTDQEERLIAELFAANAGLILDGAEPRNRVDTVEFY